MGKRRKYTDEERAQRDAADQAIKDTADQRLGDPAAVATMIATLGQITTPALLRYSLRNLAMLMTQAEERGITLTDVDTHKGWKARGRYPAQQGLRIVAFKGKEKAEGQDDDQATPTEAITLDGDQDQEGKNAFKQRFRMATVWDISQTEPTDNFEGEPVEAEHVTDPAEAIRANLTDQLERLGYTITTGDAEAVDVDDDAHTVTVSETRTVEHLGQALAQLITRPPGQRPRPIAPARTSARRAVAEQIPAGLIALDLAEFGNAIAAVEIDHDTGRAHYRVTGSNVRGCFTVTFENPAATGEPGRVYVIYGYDNVPGGFQFRQRERPERPTVNGIDLVGGGYVTLAEVDTFRWLYVGRPRGQYNDSTAVPDRTADRTRAVVRAILRHFRELAEFTDLFRRAAALEAPALESAKVREADKLAEKIAELEAARDEATRRAGYYASVAAGGEIEGSQTEHDIPA